MGIARRLSGKLRGKDKLRPKGTADAGLYESWTTAPGGLDSSCDMNAVANVRTGMGDGMPESRPVQPGLSQQSRSMPAINMLNSSATFNPNSTFNPNDTLVPLYGGGNTAYGSALQSPTATLRPGSQGMFSEDQFACAGKPIALTLGENRIVFHDGFWGPEELATERPAPASTVDSKKVAEQEREVQRIRNANRNLKEENNMLKAKLDVLLDMMSIECLDHLETAKELKSKHAVGQWKTASTSAKHLIHA